MVKHALISVLMLLVSLLLLAGCGSSEITLGDITSLNGFDIAAQVPDSIWLSIDKSLLDEGKSEYGSDEIICFFDNRCTIYVKEFRFTEDKSYVRIGFDMKYELDRHGTILLPYIINIDGDEITYRSSVLKPMAFAVVCGSDVYPDSVSMASSGPSEQFGIYIKAEIFDKLSGEFKVKISDFNELTYKKK